MQEGEKVTRKILSSLLLVSMIFVLAACGNEQAAEENEEALISESETADLAEQEDFDMADSPPVT